MLERLFNESAGDLARYFSRRHGVGVMVQDLVQETFLQMARGLKEGRQLKCARGYLFGIARHLSQAGVGAEVAGGGGAFRYSGGSGRGQHTRADAG